MHIFIYLYSQSQTEPTKYCKNLGSSVFNLYDFKKILYHWICYHIFLINKIFLNSTKSFASCFHILFFFLRVFIYRLSVYKKKSIYIYFFIYKMFFLRGFWYSCCMLLTFEVFRKWELFFFMIIIFWGFMRLFCSTFFFCVPFCFVEGSICLL